MGAASSIEWTDASWSPVRARNKATGKVGWHCVHKSPGCENCYSEGINKRLGTGLPFKPGHEKDIEVFLDEAMLLAPLRWKKPRMIFVCSMTDLFGEFVKDEWIDRIFAVMALAPQHTFQVLTKRSRRMREYLVASRAAPVGMTAMEITLDAHAAHARSNVGAGVMLTGDIPHLKVWPLANVWLGVSAEDQQRYDERASDLRATAAAIRFFSLEPLLGKIVGDWFGDLAIIGGESGPKARPCWAPDVRALVKQVSRSGAAAFVKQLGANVQDRNDAGFEGCEPREWPNMDIGRIEHDINGVREEYQGAPVRIHLRDRKGGDMAEWPDDLRVRVMPLARIAESAQ